MKSGNDQGLLLPQVPVEEKWDRKTFLEMTCAKAGMDSNCWKDPNTDIFEFTAVVFSETKPPVPETLAPASLQLQPPPQAQGSPQH